MDHSWESIASSGPATKVATVPRGAPPVTVAKGGLQTGHVKACHIAKGDRPKVTVTKGDNVAHVKACQDADCVRCRYLRNRGAWKTKLPIDNPGHRCTSWLCDKYAKGLAIGCRVCHYAGTGCPWGTFQIKTAGQLQMCHLLQHHKCATHKAAAANYDQNHEDANIACTAPTQDEFAAVLESRLNGTSLRIGVDKVARRCKAERMQWCLAEAKRNLHRQFLGKAGAIVFHQDGRSPRLLTRFTACTPNLERRSGVLGHIKGYMPGHVGIAKATTPRNISESETP